MLSVFVCLDIPEMPIAFVIMSQEEILKYSDLVNQILADKMPTALLMVKLAPANAMLSIMAIPMKAVVQNALQIVIAPQIRHVKIKSVKILVQGSAV